MCSFGFSFVFEDALNNLTLQFESGKFSVELSHHID